mgnify:CR=1 FL=1
MLNIICLVLQFILLLIQVFVFYKIKKQNKEDMNTIIFRLQKETTTKKTNKNSKTKKEGK